MRPKIAFFKLGSFSHINSSVERILAKNFTEYDVETIDVGRLLHHRPDIILRNAPAMLRLYGRDLVGRRRSLEDCFYHTPYLFSAIRRLARAHLGKNGGLYRFTVQTQSLWDAGTEDLPHFVYTDHTHLVNLTYPSFDRMRLFPAAWTACEREIYHRATRVFTMSQHVAESLREQYGCPHEKIACIYAGSNAETMALANDDYSNKHILFVGVAWGRKGGPDLAEAFQRVLGRHPDAHLTILGCSPSITIPNCTVAGRVPLAQVKEFYRRASIFCLPTKVEPFGIVFVEAMLNRLPIVATDIGALPDMVANGRTGRLVPPGNVEALTAALNELLDSPGLCRQLGEQGHELAVERYTWEAVGRRLRGEIDECLSRPTVPRLPTTPAL